MPGGYSPIGDYGLIGDTRSAALVGRDGSIDWCCWPDFDSPALFCRLLDARKGGSFRVGLAQGAAVARAYVAETNVLVSTFTDEGGVVRLTDFMPLPREGPASRRPGPRRLLRLVEGVEGEVELTVRFHPTFDYAREAGEIAVTAAGAVARGAGASLTLSCAAPLSHRGDGALVGRLRVRAGERQWLILCFHGSDGSASVPDADGAEEELAATLDGWRRWSRQCTYEGPYHPMVRRSALALELLTYAPTGALVAAPTTSLPEEIGGVRNWDYRYTWLRDSAMILYSLAAIGYHREAVAFFDWLERLCLGCCGAPQILYTVRGEAEVPERSLDHLEGYRRSRPVRVGNAAASQTQLDVFGEVLDAAHFCFERLPRELDPGLGRVLAFFADQAAARWREPDYGIWEVRGGPRHFLYSKLLCWVALDRALELARDGRLRGDVTQWRQQRDEIRRAIVSEGYDSQLGAFTQALGEPALDASALAIPLVGFLPPTDPRVQSTVRSIQERLTTNGLVYRYLGDDGLPGGEATFALCSFWLVEALALGGRIDEARELFERVAGYANDLGLLAEEIAPESRELLGNFPQGFTHLALIRAASSIAKAEARGPEERAERPAERERAVEEVGAGATGGRAPRGRGAP